MPHLRDRETRRDRRTARYTNWDGIDDAADGAFKDLIQRDPVICDHCFLYRYDAMTVEWWRGDPELGWMQYEHWLPIRGRNADVPADDGPSQGLRLACSHCGYRRDKHRPVGADDVRQFTHHIVEALELKSIGFDRSRLFAEVEERMTEPENQGRQDTHVWSPAVERAIQSQP